MACGEPRGASVGRVSSPEAKLSGDAGESSPSEEHPGIEWVVGLFLVTLAVVLAPSAFFDPGPRERLFLQVLLILAVIVFVLRDRDTVAKALPGGVTVESLLLAFAAGLGTSTAALAYGSLIGIVSHSRDPSDPKALSAALVFVSGVVIPAVAEEIAFRGLLQAWLRRWLTMRGAIVTTAFMFAILHMSIFFPVHFLIGVVCGALRQRWRSLLPPMLAHAVHNTLVLMAAQ